MFSPPFLTSGDEIQKRCEQNNAAQLRKAKQCSWWPTAAKLIRRPMYLYIACKLKVATFRYGTREASHNEKLSINLTARNECFQKCILQHVFFPGFKYHTCSMTFNRLQLVSKQTGWTTSIHYFCVWHIPHTIQKMNKRQGSVTNLKR